MSDDGRRLVGRIMELVRVERRNRPSRIVPLTAGDAASFILAPLPLLDLPEETRGSCVLTVELDREDPGVGRSASVSVRIREGRVVEHSRHPPRRPPSAFASGPVDGWLDALLDGETRGLRLGGRVALVGSLIAAMHTEIGAAGAGDGLPLPDQEAGCGDTALGTAFGDSERPGMAVFALLDGLGPVGREVIRYLGSHADSTAERIAADLGLGVTEVERALRRLDRLGVLDVDVESGGCPGEGRDRRGFPG